SSNIALSWLVIALAVLVNTPLLDPYRIVVDSQTKQLLARTGTVNPDAEREDLEFLRFDNGRRGYQALQALRTTPAFANDAKRSKRLDQVLARQQRWELEAAPENLRRTRISDPDALRAHLAIATGSQAPDPDWWQALAQGKLDADVCLQPDRECIVSSQDIDGDGQNDALLCDISDRFGIRCFLYTRDAQGWYEVDTLDSLPERKQDQEALREAVRQGRLTTHQRRWPDLQFPGAERMRIAPSANARTREQKP
ncbi:membrane protein, partial [Xanthomonas vesicatoria]